MWCFLNYVCKVIIRSKLNYFWFIKQKLDVKHRILFQSTCFGPWLDLLLFDHEPLLIEYMLRRQHKVDDQHHDMPLIYYMEGHKLHFGGQEFSLITDFRFGTVSFDLHSSGELKFQNMVFPNKISFTITNLDIIGVIEDKEIFCKLFDDDAIRLCLLLALEVLLHERSGRQAKLKFTDEFSSMTSDLCDSLNSMFADLIEPADPDEDIIQDYLREEELRMCLEGEEKMRCEHQKLFVEENMIRLDESKRLRLEEENMLQLEQQKKNKRNEFMNSNCYKSLLSKLAPATRIQLCSSSEKIQPKDTSRVLQSMDTVWLIDDIKCFLGQSGQVKCKFPWNDDYIVDRNFWLKLVCLDPTRKGWLTKELLLQNGMPLFYANGERYTTTWSEVDQFHIMSGEVTCYDIGHTYDYDYRDWLTHGLSLDVDDPVDVALAYRENMV
uniref:Phospholipase-like protein n=1 Tax=Tanacetum cinerariifolium TaxID=118510 RepID=A0A699HM46_TANCI|nr:phospholipase-like protein [Tanacetum cinerariifolium]